MQRKTKLLLLIHLAATLFMTGVIWFVQFVHYPLMALVDPMTWEAYARANIARTSALVGPVMLLEALTGALLVWRRPAKVSAGQAWLGIALLALAWGSTALAQFPAHKALAQGFDQDLVQRLILGNWLRTAAWTARALLALRMASESA